MNQQQNLRIAQFNGLNTSGVMKKVGDLQSAINIDLLADKSIQTRLPTRNVSSGEQAADTAGFDTMYQFTKGNGRKFIFADVRYVAEEAKYQAWGDAPPREVIRGRVVVSENTPTANAIELGGWSMLKSDLLVSITNRSSWTTMQDRAFRFDGINRNLQFEDNLYSRQVSIEPPATALEGVAGTAGNMQPGEYWLYYRYHIQEGSRLVKSNPSPMSGSINVTSTTGAIDVEILNEHLSTHPDVSYIVIYRNLPGSANRFYEAKRVPNIPGIWKLDASDALVAANEELEFDNYVVPRCKYVSHASSRLFFANSREDLTSGSASHLMWSKIAQPEHWDGSFESFDPRDGQEITGISDEVQGNILVFKSSKTWLFNPSTLMKFALDMKRGCVSSRSIRTVAGGVMWLSAEGVLFYDGSQIVNVSKNPRFDISDIIQPYIGGEWGDWIEATWDPTNKRYHLLLNDRHDYRLSWEGYLVTVSQNMPGGTLTHLGTGTLGLGDDLSIQSVSVANKFTLLGVTGNGTFREETSYEIENCSNNHTVEFIYEREPFTIMATSDANGYVIPEGLIEKEYGSHQSISYVPNNGYYFSHWDVDGVSVTGTHPYLFDNIQNDHIIIGYGTDTPPYYYVEVKALPSGSGTVPFTPPDLIFLQYEEYSVPVANGANIEFSANPARNKIFEKWIVDDVEITNPAPILFESISDNHTVHAYFKNVDPDDPSDYVNFTLSIADGHSGTIEPRIPGTYSVPKNFYYYLVCKPDLAVSFHVTSGVYPGGQVLSPDIGDGNLWNGIYLNWQHFTQDVTVEVRFE